MIFFHRIEPAPPRVMLAGRIVDVFDDFFTFRFSGEQHVRPLTLSGIKNGYKRYLKPGDQAFINDIQIDPLNVRISVTLYLNNFSISVNDLMRNNKKTSCCSIC